MPLFLSYSLNPAALLEEMLDSLVERHFHFNLRDNFLIVTPYEEARQDVERAVLTHPKLEGVLIGRSILTLSSLIQNLLFYHPQPLPSASVFRMRKCLTEALKSVRPSWQPNLQTQKNLVRELNRLEQLTYLTGKTWRPTWAVRLLEKWKTDLAGHYKAWTRSQAAEAAWDLVERKTIPFLNDIRDIYFLGFPLPDGELLRCLEVFRNRYPGINLHLYLPPPEMVIDKEGWMIGPLERLTNWANSSPVFHSAAVPLFRKRSYATPLHEVRHALLEGTRGTETTLFLSPPAGSVHECLEELVIQTYFSEGVISRLHPLSSTAGLAALDTLESSSEGEIGLFETFYLQLLPRLEAARRLAARVQDGPTLRYCEAVFNLLSDWAQVEKFSPHSASMAEWTQELREEILDLDLFSPVGVSRHFPLRAIDHAGLIRVDRVYAMGLNDGIYPPMPRPFQLAEDLSDTLNSHEKTLALQMACRLAKEETILTFSEFSLSGKVLKPALAVTDAKEIIATAPIHALPVWAHRRHPYFEENLRRERARVAGEACTQDAGNLQGFGLGSYLLEKARSRPLAATYLDDYARCPWRFFAKWHLGLGEKRKEELELEPLQRGRFQHEILEKLFRGFSEDFSQHTFPSPDGVEAAFASEFEKLSEALMAREEYREWPPAVVRDQLARLRRQVANLLAEEQLHWSEAKEKLFPRHLEWSFGKGGNPPISFLLEGGYSVPLAGAIDRIDVSADGKRYLVLDYKASSTDELSRELRDLRSFQLYLYLHAVREMLFPNAEALGALYWDLKEKKRNQGMVRADAFVPFCVKPPKGNSFLKEEDFLEMYAALEQNLRLLLRRILEGDYSLQPPACLGSRCEFSEICRYADQPR